MDVGAVGTTLGAVGDDVGALGTILGALGDDVGALGGDADRVASPVERANQ